MSDGMAEDRLSLLEQKHRNLNEEVDRLERRPYLTPEEQRQVTELKKQKLAAKDEIFAIRQQT